MKLIMSVLLFLLAFSSNAQRLAADGDTVMLWSRPGEEVYRVAQSNMWKLCWTDGVKFSCGDCVVNKSALEEVAKTRNKKSDVDWVVIPCEADLEAMTPREDPKEEDKSVIQEVFIGTGAFSTMVEFEDSRNVGLHAELGVTIYDHNRDLFVEPSVGYNSVYSETHGTVRTVTPALFIGGYPADFWAIGLRFQYFYSKKFETFGVSANTNIRLVSFSDFNIDVIGGLGTSDFSGLFMNGSIRVSWRIP